MVGKAKRKSRMRKNGQNCTTTHTTTEKEQPLQQNLLPTPPPSPAPVNGTELEDDASSSIVLPKDADGVSPQSEDNLKIQTKMESESDRQVSVIDTTSEQETVPPLAPEHSIPNIKNANGLCEPYMEVKTKAGAKLMIAARDLTPGCPVIIDDLVISLPMNPSLESRTFPSNYCVKCFRFYYNPYVIECCPSGCQLPVCQLSLCKNPGIRPESLKQARVPAHGQLECRVFTEATSRGVDKQHSLIVDQSVLGLLRCMKRENTSKAFHHLVKSIKPGPRTKNFESKLQLIRNLLLIDSSVCGKHLYKIDQALLRFGRNIGPTTVSFHELKTLDSLYTRVIYPKLSSVVHSCVPNTIFFLMGGMAATTYAVKEIKKGDVLTICYDERAFFMPTRHRRRFLRDQFGLSCECERCSSPSELDTYFSSFPCSNCPKGQAGYLVPDNPLDPHSNWMCHNCKTVSVFYLRVIDTGISLEEELETQIKKQDPLGLLALMEELATENCLHWNHHLIFEASIKLFQLLWRALSKNELKVMEVYSKDRGLQFLKPAETVINVTGAFMPHGYANEYILPIRLAALIKLRHLIHQLQRKEITIDHVNGVLDSLYFRGYSLSNRPLYERLVDPMPNYPSIPPGTERNLRIMEMRVVQDLAKNVDKPMPNCEKGANLKAPGRLELLLENTKRDIPMLTVVGKEIGFQGHPMFPWGVDV